MPNDAKLGLVLGMGLVIAIGVVFYRKEPGQASTPVATPAAVTPGAAPRGKAAKARTTSEQLEAKAESEETAREE